MKIKRYKRKGTIEALQWKNNLDAVEDFIGPLRYDGLFAEEKHPPLIRIKNLNGAVYAKEGDYIIKHDTDECYPCHPDVFRMTYEEVTE